MQKCGRALAPRDQEVNYFEAEWITRGCICTVRKEESQRRVKTIVTLWILSTKKIISHSVTRWLSLYRSLPRMLQLCPASNSYFMSIDKPVVVLKTFFWKLFGRTLWHLQSFVAVFIEQVQNIEKSKASFVDVVSCFATVKTRIQKRQPDVHVKPSWISTKKI